MELIKRQKRAFGERLGGDAGFQGFILLHHPGNDVWTGAKTQCEADHGLCIGISDLVEVTDEPAGAIRLGADEEMERIFRKKWQPKPR